MIMFIPWPRAVRSMVPCPTHAHWPTGGYLVEEVALFNVSWCVPALLAPSCFTQADHASAGCQSWCSTVSVARLAGSREGGGVLTQGRGRAAVMFLPDFYKRETFAPLDHTPLIYRVFYGSRSYYGV